MNAEELKRFIAEYTEDVWNQRRVNVDAIDKYYAPTYVHHDPSRLDVMTLADYKGWARDLQTGLSDLHVAADDLIAEGSMAVKRWTATGVHAASLAGLPPTHARRTHTPEQERHGRPQKRASGARGPRRPPDGPPRRCVARPRPSRPPPPAAR